MFFKFVYVLTFYLFASILKNQCSFTIWGRNGFDGDFEARGSMPSFLSARKLGKELNIIADDYNYAVAA